MTKNSLLAFILFFKIASTAYADNERVLLQTNKKLELSLFTDGVNLPLFPEGKTSEMWRYTNQEVAEFHSTLLIEVQLKSIIFTPQKITFIFNYPYDFRLQYPGGETEEKSLSEWSITPRKGTLYGRAKLNYLKALVLGAGEQLYLEDRGAVGVEQMLAAFRSRNIGLLTSDYGLLDFPRVYIISPTIKLSQNYLLKDTTNPLRTNLKPIHADFSGPQVNLVFSPSTTYSRENIEGLIPINFGQASSREILKAIEEVRRSRASQFLSIKKTADGGFVVYAPESNGASNEEMQKLFSPQKSISCKKILTL